VTIDDKRPTMSSSTPYAPYSCMANPTQETLRVILPKITASLSIIGSLHVILSICSKYRMSIRKTTPSSSGARRSSTQQPQPQNPNPPRRQRRRNSHTRTPTSYASPYSPHSPPQPHVQIDPYQRIMVGFSVMDVLFNIFYFFMGTWLTPVETGWWGAMGNRGSCSLQGFFFFVYGCAAYQITLALQVLLLVPYMWTPTQFAELLERKLHFVNIAFTVVVACLPLCFEGYNPYCGTCRAVPLPYWCGDWALSGDSYDDGKEEKEDATTAALATTTPCLRGNSTLSNAYHYLLIVTLSITTVFCTVSMIVIYLSVYLQEKRMLKYNFGDSADDYYDNTNDAARNNNTNDDDDNGNGNSNGQSNRSNRSSTNGGNENFRDSQRIRRTMLLYCSSFYICWILPLAFWYGPHDVKALYVLGDMLFSLMGFFNMLVFTHPKCIKYQEDHPGNPSLVKCYISIIFQTQIEFIQNVKRKWKKSTTNTTTASITSTSTTKQPTLEDDIVEKKAEKQEGREEGTAGDTTSS